MEKGDKKRAAVIQASLELVAEHGFHGTPMAMIAERAGVAAGTIYRYFESKDVLIRETHAYLEQQIAAAYMAEYPEGQPVRQRFLHIWQRLVNYLIAHPLEFRFMEQFYNSPYGVDARREKTLRKSDKYILVQLFDEGQQQQIIKELPLSILFALTFGPLVDLCRDHILQFFQLDEQMIACTAEACWDAVRR